MKNDPFELFKEWYTLAHSSEKEPTAMSLATVGVDLLPSCRIVLLKQYDRDGFVFYTNMTSRKGQDLAENASAALCFFWSSIDKQIRIEGCVEVVDSRQADEYFATRPRMSQLGAWASKQSQTLTSRQSLEQKLHELEEKYQGKTVDRPEFWTGYRVSASRIEFWDKGDFRIHDRRLFILSGAQWQESLLYP